MTVLSNTCFIIIWITKCFWVSHLFIILACFEISFFVTGSLKGYYQLQKKPWNSTKKCCVYSLGPLRTLFKEISAWRSGLCESVALTHPCALESTHRSHVYMTRWLCSSLGILRSSIAWQQLWCNTTAQ